MRGRHYKHTTWHSYCRMILHRLSCQHTRRIHLKKIIRKIKIKPSQLNKTRLDTYFPPATCPEGEVLHWRRITNGIFFVYGYQSVYFAVHEKIAEYYLTAPAAAYGYYQEDYLFYSPLECAPAVFELERAFPALGQVLENRSSLYATLQRYYADYVDFYNGREDERPIEPTQVAAGTFLKSEYLIKKGGLS